MTTLTTPAVESVVATAGAITPREVGGPARAGLTATDLAELIASFNEVTSRLQATHETLRSEVSRLEGELREAHSQLERARQLAALGEMAAGIAHEVRNPLGSIRLYCSMLVQDLTDRPDERGVAIKIGTAVSRLDAVVGDVLAFARELKVRQEDASAGTLLDDAVEACADLWIAGGIEVELARSAKREQMVRCDPGLTQQALVNVLRNAGQAMAESASAERRLVLDVQRRRVMGPGGRRTPMAALVIRDTGPGVPREAIERVFNPFFTTRHTGTGLGLAIVHRIVDAQGGRVSIRNNADDAPGARGATVEILLPAGGGESERQAGVP